MGPNSHSFQTVTKTRNDSDVLEGDESSESVWKRRSTSRRSLKTKKRGGRERFVVNANERKGDKHGL